MWSKLDAALYARRYFDVFPVAPNSKVPLLKENWLKIATRDEAQIRQWWTEHPHANIGGVTNDKLVFDIDPRNGGVETFAVLADMNEITKTARTETAGGGAHVIYEAPDGQKVKGGTNKAGPGVDIKAGGGYIVLPGSTIDGKKYAWANKAEIARAPAWAVEMCKRARTRTDTAGKRVVEEDDTAREMFEQWLANHAPRAELGDVDDTTYKVAARGYDFGCSEATVYELVSEWDETHCFPRNEPDRLPVVVNSAGRNRDNAIGSRHPAAPGFEAVEIDESKAPNLESVLAHKAKRTDGLKLEGYLEAAARALAEQAEPLIKGILDRGAMSILYGESNTGKTFMAVDMAFHIASGRPWARRKVRRGAVVYVAAEGGAGVYKRLAALLEHYPDAGDIPLFVIKFPIDLLHGKEHAQALVKLCIEAASRGGLPLELVVIDTVSRALSGGDENSSSDMGAIVKAFDALREATSAHLMGIHHSGKDRARGARGHSLLRAATDTEIEIERGKLTVTKQRDMEGDFKQPFRLRTIPLGVDADGGVVSSCIVELTEDHGAEEVEVALTGAQRTVMHLISLMVHGSTEISFTAKDLLDSYPNKTAPDRSTLVGHLTAITNKGLIRKPKSNQYFMR